MAMKSIFEKYTFDADISPGGCMQFVVVSGSWYDMGRQYAMQCRKGLMARTADLMAVYLRQYGRKETIYQLCEDYMRAAKEEFPQLLALLSGMAEELGYPWQEMVVVLYGKSMLRAETESEQVAEHACSQIAAWEPMTENGHLLGAGNMDLPFDAREYLPAIVAFPEDGYAFVSSDMFHRAGLNEKGLLVQGSGGQNAGTGDMRRLPDRHMWNDAFIYALAYCDSTNQALKHHRSWKYITGCNQGFGDAGHDVAIVEFTAEKYYVRQSGDFGEKGYLLANNGYNIPDMQSSLMQREAYWTDCLPRYWSAEQYLKEHAGHVTLDVMYDAQSLNRFYIPEGWTLRLREDWGTYFWYQEEASQSGRKDVMVSGGGWQQNWSPAYNNWAMQCRDYAFRTTVRHVIDVDDLSFYIQKGCREPVLSAQPDTTGTFCRIQLGGDIYQILDRAKAELECQIWCAARDCMKTDAGEKMETSLNEAKKCMYRGINYMALSVHAGYESNIDEKNSLAGKALTAFATGQCYARAARQHPTAFR